VAVPCEYGNETSGYINGEKFVDKFLKRALLHGVR
jgi:hypothetical protein